ncbi:MAG: NADH:flavin oxidoreductase [Spirochaetota bacterium]|nr:NADH:flavin oxidoreductase [Spirochaetota bacterium]
MSVLFTEGRIGILSISNRFVRSATAECLASDDGRITEEYLRAYERLAKGGVGLIISGNMYINAIGKAIPRMLVIDKDEMIDDLSKVTQMVHQHGAKIVAQLNHGGRQCDSKVLGIKTIAPSPVRYRLTFVKPREMSENEIEETIECFGEAARRVKEAGYDGVQIHAAHGYLINQFLSGYTNRRSDRWGGSLENRMRFLIAVYHRIRSKVGTDYPILIKLNADDFTKGGVTLVQCIGICMKLDEIGINAIEVSGGIAERGLHIIRGDLPIDIALRDRNIIERILIHLLKGSIRKESSFEESYFLTYAAEIKKHVDVPVIAVGGMRHRETMERALRDGQADYISMCRPFIRQPNLVNLLKKDDGYSISCTNCNRCTLEIASHYNPMKCYNSKSFS